jgi:hypothetical protein
MEVVHRSGKPPFRFTLKCRLAKRFYSVQGRSFAASEATGRRQLKEQKRSTALVSGGPRQPPRVVVLSLGKPRS